MTRPRCSWSKRPAEVDTTLEEVQPEIDAAIANKEWLILTFHQVKVGMEQYTTSPEMLNDIVDYLVQTGVTVIPIAEGISSMLP